MSVFVVVFFLMEIMALSYGRTPMENVHSCSDLRCRVTPCIGNQYLHLLLHCLFSYVTSSLKPLSQLVDDAFQGLMFDLQHTHKTIGERDNLIIVTQTVVHQSTARRYRFITIHSLSSLLCTLGNLRFASVISVDVRSPPTSSYICVLSLSSRVIPY